MNKLKNHHLHAEFIKSSYNLSQCPDLSLPEIALVGRSNVGKSSLINSIINNRKLAKISSTPGKTQHINHFLVNNIYIPPKDISNSSQDTIKKHNIHQNLISNTYKWCLVDLPGYGWAKVSKVQRFRWSKLIRDYLLKRKELYCTFVLVDSRLPPQQIDIEFINWLGKNHIALAIIFSKIDKINKNQLEFAIEQYEEAILKTWSEVPKILLTSAKQNKGIDYLLAFIEKVLY